MLHDDRPDYPMTFALRLRFAGQMRRAEFEAAFAEALAGHPLLTAVVKQSASRGWVWRLAKGQKPVVNWGLSDNPIVTPDGEWIDLRREVGLRAWVRADETAAEATLQFHHACCDGSGAVAFARQLLAAYGARTAAADALPNVPNPVPAGLCNRWRFEFKPLAERPSRLRLLGNGLRDGWRWMCRRPAPLCSPWPVLGDAATPRPLLEMFYHPFDAEFSRLLRRTATRRGQTLSDVLLGDLFVTLCRWNLDHDDRAADRWLRIAVPVKLRTIDRREPSAANAMSFNFITRRESQCADRDGLLEGIHRENGPASRLQRTRLFVRGLSLLSLFPGALERTVSSRRCWSTAVLSNISNVNRMFSGIPQRDGKLAVGNLLLEDIYGAPPVRPNTAAAFATGTYAGRLWITLRRDPRAISADDARRLLAMYVERLTESAAETA
jgi:hypothetical protein